MIRLKFKEYSQINTVSAHVKVRYTLYTHLISNVLQILRLLKVFT